MNLELLTALIERMHQHTQTVVPADVGHWIAELEALLAESPQEAAPSSGWQPIATAPKDGKPFIAANHMDAFRAFYDTDEDCQVFTAEDSGLWFGQMEHPPTHWMPLPPR